MKESNRAKEWGRFSEIVRKHINEYTVSQYGDMPTDPVSLFTLNDFLTQLRKYVVRQINGGGARGATEQRRDFLKIAHYACMAYSLLEKEQNNAR